MTVTFSQAVVVYTFNPTQYSGDDLCESKAILAYRVGSRTARATQRNQVSKNQSQKTKKKVTFGSNWIPGTERLGLAEYRVSDN